MEYWTYESDLGQLSIRPMRSGKWAIYLDDELMDAHYSHPEEAASNIYTCTTGHDEWDDQGSVDQPTDLSEWTRRRFS